MRFRFPNLSIQTFSNLLLSLSLMVVSCLLFYATVPYLRLTSHIVNADEVANKIINTTTVDAVIIWDMDVAKNSRTSLGFSVRNQNEKETVAKIIHSLKDVRLSSALGATELHAMLSAEPMCSKTPEVTSSTSPITKKFILSHPDAYYCLIPIIDVSGSVSGLVNAVWYSQPTDDILSGTIAQTRHLVKTS